MNLISRDMKSELVRMARNYAVMGRFGQGSLDDVLTFIDLVSEPEVKKTEGGILEFPRENWVGEKPRQATPPGQPSLWDSPLTAEAELTALGVPPKAVRRLCEQGITKATLLGMSEKDLMPALLTCPGIGHVTARRLINDLKNLRGNTPTRPNPNRESEGEGETAGA